jgi:hypothetical protein
MRGIIQSLVISPKMRLAIVRTKSAVLQLSRRTPFRLPTLSEVSSSIGHNARRSIDQQTVVARA